MDINVRRRSQVQVVHLRGQLRMGPAVDSLRQTLEEALGSGDTRIVVDLAEVPMIDSSGIGLLVQVLASAKRSGGRLLVADILAFSEADAHAILIDRGSDDGLKLGGVHRVGMLVDIDKRRPCAAQAGVTPSGSDASIE
jgi:anti-anti-sigma factor